MVATGLPVTYWRDAPDAEVATVLDVLERRAAGGRRPAGNPAARLTTPTRPEDLEAAADG